MHLLMTYFEIDVFLCLQSEFYGQVVVGSPGKTFNVAFDTTWPYSWLMSSQCDTEVVGCWFHNKYNNHDSSTYQKDDRPFNMDVGDYNLTGFYSRDTFSVGFFFVELNKAIILFVCFFLFTDWPLQIE